MLQALITVARARERLPWPVRRAHGPASISGHGAYRGARVLAERFHQRDRGVRGQQGVGAEVDDLPGALVERCASQRNLR